MGYKAKFPALEVYVGGQWQPLGNPAQYSKPDTTRSRSIRSRQQVAQISLPDLRKRRLNAVPCHAAGAGLRGRTGVLRGRSRLEL